ncbi:hypothetical protein NSTCB13_06342 [Nostoc sp. DSM 114160]|jgi:superfamily II DNA/RNA helicase
MDRYQADPRVEKLVAWIKQNLCPNLGKPNAAWLDKRVIIFTEYTDTKRYLEQKLQEAIAGSDRERDRIDVFHGGIGEERGEAIKNAFNSDPSRHPLRILIATDAAREGVNLQNNCADLFHFDVPWNPSRMEQRNGRIDRKLQRSPVVHCYYFVLAQRTEDKVLKVLVKKTETIQKELGTLSPVVQKNLSRLLSDGIRHNQVTNITASIEQADLPNLSVISEELEENRLRKEELTKELSQLQEMLKTSRDWLGLSDDHFRNAISASLEILALFRELQQRQLTRERVAVEHSLFHIGRWQTDKARYVGSRKNLFDLRRTAVVHNLHIIAKFFTHTTEHSATSS